MVKKLLLIVCQQAFGLITRYGKLCFLNYVFFFSYRLIFWQSLEHMKMEGTNQ